MNHQQVPRPHKVDAEARETEPLDLLKEAFVCVSIPVAAFAFTYIALDTLIGLILG